MSVLDRAHAYEAGPRQVELELLSQQLGAIDAWNAARHARTVALLPPAGSREAGLDRARQRQVLVREHHALVARTHAQLLTDPNSGARRDAPRAVLIQRNPCSFHAISRALTDVGVEVVGRLVNGADGIGFAVAEQPDLALVDQTLAMVPGSAVVRELRLFAPRTLVAVQVEHVDAIGSLLEAGARVVFTRRHRPRDVVRELVQVLRADAGSALAAAETWQRA